MPFGFKRMFTGRRILAAAILYLALWTITQALGPSRICAELLSEFVRDGDSRRLEVSKCEGFAIAPFAVRAHYDFWDDDGDLGESASALHLWFGGKGRQLYVWNVTTK